MAVLSDFNERYFAQDPRISSKLKNFLIPDFFSSTYELAGKKLVCAAKVLSGRRNIRDVGDALNVLARSPHRLYFKSHFDNTLRNGIFHQNYLVDDSHVPPVMEYVNVKLNRARTTTVIGRLQSIAI